MISLLILWCYLVNSMNESFEEKFDFFINSQNSFVKFEQVPSEFPKAELREFENYINSIAKKNHLDPANDGLSLFIEIVDIIRDDNYVEAYKIELEDNKVRITGNNILSCQDALNDYLFTLGLRIYLPSEKWTYLPTVENLLIKDKGTTSPLYRNRLIFSSYGTGVNSAYKDNYQDFENWEIWMNDNRMTSYDFKVGGHYGIIFNKKYQKELIKCKECRPEINGKRIDFSDMMKLCYSEEKNIQLMSKDVVNRYYENLANFSPNPNYINIDPSDGGGFCTCDRCKSKGIVTNQVFFFVNEVAKIVKQQNPNIKITHLAYNEYSKKPDLDLEDNIVIYYADFGNKLEFQNELSDWNTSGNLEGLRLYYGNVSDDSGVTISEVSDEFQILKNFRLQGYKIESSYGGLNNGLLQYYIGRLSWDKNYNSDLFFKEISQNLFTVYSDEFQNLLENINQIGNDRGRLIYSKGLLESLKSRNLNESEINILNDLQIYLGYLNLLFEDRDDSWEKRIIDYLWSYPNSFYLFNRMGFVKNINVRINKRNQKSWLYENVLNPKKPYSIQQKPINSAYETIDLIKVDKKSGLNRSTSYQESEFDFINPPNIIKLTPSSSIKFRKTLSGRIFIRDKSAKISLDKIDTKNTQKEKWGELRFYDENNLLDTILEINSNMNILKLEDLIDKWYKFEFFGIPETFIMTTTQNNVILYKTPVRKFVGPEETYFFFKPEGVSNVYITIPKDCRVFTVRNSIDQIIYELPKNQKELFTANISTSNNEQILKINTKRSTFSILNNLDYVATAPEFIEAIKIKYE